MSVAVPDLVLVRPMRVALFAILGLVVLVATTRAGDARVELARLDGTPVYHWRVFHSYYGDDVDRALILREFHRQGYDIPQRFVDARLAEIVDQDYGGDEKRLIEKLRKSGVTLQDYKAFIGEEMILAAMIAREAKRTKEFSRDRWLAALKKHAKIDQHPRPKALLIYSPQVPYPYDVRAQNKGGSGIFILHVDEATGSVSQVTVQKSAGVQELDDSSVDTLCRWQFMPHTGVKKVEIPVTFTMDLIYRR